MIYINIFSSSKNHLKTIRVNKLMRNIFVSDDISTPEKMDKVYKMLKYMFRVIYKTDFPYEEFLEEVKKDNQTIRCIIPDVSEQSYQKVQKYMKLHQGYVLESTPEKTLKKTVWEGELVA